MVYVCACMYVIVQSQLHTKRTGTSTGTWKTLLSPECSSNAVNTRTEFNQNQRRKLRKNRSKPIFCVSKPIFSWIDFVSIQLSKIKTAVAYIVCADLSRCLFIGKTKRVVRAIGFTINKIANYFLLYTTNTAELFPKFGLQSKKCVNYSFEWESGRETNKKKQFQRKRRQ